MGLEAQCEAEFGGKWSEGKAQLEEKELVFRGADGRRLKIPLAAVKSAEAKGGVLVLKHAGGAAKLALGAAAEKWALKIRYPRSRIEKLGVKAGARVCVVGIEDAEFAKELTRAKAQVTARGAKDCEWIFWRVDAAGELSKLRALRDALKPAGAIWVVWPKGRAEINEDHVRAAAAKIGMVDVKVMSFSKELSALKLMIRKENR